MNIIDIQNLPRLQGDIATRGIPCVVEGNYQGTTMINFWDGNEWGDIRYAVREDGELIPAGEADWLTWPDLNDFSEV